MEKQIDMSDSITEEWWSEQKNTLIDNISKAMEEEAADQDVLEIMLELVKAAKVRVSMQEYYEEEKEE